MLLINDILFQQNLAILKNNLRELLHQHDRLKLTLYLFQKIICDEKLNFL